VDKFSLGTGVRELVQGTNTPSLKSPVAGEEMMKASLLCVSSVFRHFAKWKRWCENAEGDWLTQ